MLARFTQPRHAPFLCILALALIVSTAGAQPLADRIPADAIVYVGWKGADALGPAYDASHLKAVIDASNLCELCDTFLPQLGKRIGRENAQGAALINMVLAVAKPMWNHPTAIYFTLDLNNPGMPMPHLAIICQSGPDAPALLDQLTKLCAMAPRGPFPIRSHQKGDIVAVTIGSVTPAMETAVIGAGDNRLDANATFQAALAQVNKDPVFTVFVNGALLAKTIDQAIAMQDNPQLADKWPQVRAALGLDGLKGLILACGFDGKDWTQQAFIAASAPRQGLLALLNPQAINNQTLKSIPRSATWMGVSHLDLAALMDIARQTIVGIEPNAGPQIDALLQQINAMLGFDLQKDLFASLGSEWAFYVDPNVGGTGLLGMAAFNRLADPAKAQATLDKLEIALNAGIAAAIHDPKITLAFQQKQVGDLTLHYLAAPALTPTWTIANGTLWLSLYPQVTLSAAQLAAANGPSILDNPDFQTLRKRLGIDKIADVSSISFVDLPRTAPNAYASWLLLSRLVGAADIFGVRSPLMVIPPLNKLLAELGPAGSATWTDATGWHLKSISSFPGSELLATDAMSSFGVAEPALLMSILLPALNKTRDTETRAKSASNLKQIGIGCLLYSNEDPDQKYPPDLGALLLKEDLTLAVFVNPSSGASIPPAIGNAPKEAQAAWVAANSDYVYRGAGKTPNPDSAGGSEYVLAYEKLPDGQARNVLFGDGHVAWTSFADFQRLLGQNAPAPLTPHPPRFPKNGGL